MKVTPKLLENIVGADQESHKINNTRTKQYIRSLKTLKVMFYEMIFNDDF